MILVWIAGVLFDTGDGRNTWNQGSPLIHFSFDRKTQPP